MLALLLEAKVSCVAFREDGQMDALDATEALFGRATKNLRPTRHTGAVAIAVE